MAFYQIIRTQQFPVSKAALWEFIAAPGNLKHITPGYMGFVVTSNNATERMYPGMIISYKVSPLLGLQLTWVTEITQVREQEYFVDEQRLGPYRLWHHQHKLEEIFGGVRMTDIVTYVPPFGPLGALANALFIRRQLKEIFDFRQQVLEQRFGILP